MKVPFRTLRLRGLQQNAVMTIIKKSTEKKSENLPYADLLGNTDLSVRL